MVSVVGAKELGGRRFQQAGGDRQDSFLGRKAESERGRPPGRKQEPSMGGE